MGRDIPAAAPQHLRVEAARVAWAQLAPRIAATGHMRVWSAQAGFADRQRLSQHLPVAPAAVTLYRGTRGRTGRRVSVVLALDLDAKHHGSGAVLADYVNLLGWIRQAGGRPVADVSASGGRHILVPLAVGATVEEFRPLLAALAARCPTLDRTPMLNDRTGCITAPGSACREGGHRALIGSLSEAVSAFGRRSDPDFLARLADQLGVEASPAVVSATVQPDVAEEHPDVAAEHGIFEGHGDHRRLRSCYRRPDPLNPLVDAFARTGALPADGRWPTRSEARQAVLYAAVTQGMTLAQVRSAATGRWRGGLGHAYAHYTDPQGRLRADWQKACRWIETRVEEFQQRTHKTKHTGGVREPAGCTPAHRSWLAHATLWCAVTLRSHPCRHTTAAVLQALAVMAARSGQLVDGVPVVAAGGRSLSLAAGLLSESTVWAVLRRLRDTPGSPVLLIATGRGVEADRYALVTPAVTDATPDAPGRPAVTDVHPAWAVVGHPHRRVYELVTAGYRTVEDLAAAARTSPSTVYDSLAELSRLGLVQRGRGQVQPGTTSLDDIAAAHRLDRDWAARVEAHRRARRIWRDWLDTGRRTPAVQRPVPAAPAQLGQHYGPSDPSAGDYLTSVMATGPPPVSHLL